jgi:DNA-binding response OmpR family regulator
MKILIIEDEPLMLKALKFRLNKDGYEVVIAEDGRKALQILNDEEFDLIITDVMLPFNNGLEIVDFVKNKKKLNTPIVILSSVGAENAVLDGFAIGADDYITKPFSPTELSVRIKRLLKA